MQTCLSASNMRVCSLTNPSSQLTGLASSWHLSRCSVCFFTSFTRKWFLSRLPWSMMLSAPLSQSFGCSRVPTSGEMQKVNLHPGDSFISEVYSWRGEIPIKYWVVLSCLLSAQISGETAPQYFSCTLVHYWRLYAVDAIVLQQYEQMTSLYCLLYKLISV